MQVKRFFAADMRQAMKLIRDELGLTPPLLATAASPGALS